LLACIGATGTLQHIIAVMTLYDIVAFNTIVVVVVPLDTFGISVYSRGYSKLLLYFSILLLSSLFFSFL
jgi:hypothetical protein